MKKSRSQTILCCNQLIANMLDGRGGGIRTPDPLLPKQMRYQTALRPDSLLVYRIGHESASQHTEQPVGACPEQRMEQAIEDPCNQEHG